MKIFYNPRKDEYRTEKGSMGEQDRFRAMVAGIRDLHPPAPAKNGGPEAYAPKPTQPAKQPDDLQELAKWIVFLKFTDMMGLCDYIMANDPPKTSIELAHKLIEWGDKQLNGG